MAILLTVAFYINLAATLNVAKPNILRRRKVKTFMLRNMFVLLIVAFIGGFYYKFFRSRNRISNNIVFGMKISFFVLSFILEFTQQEYIVIEGLAFGGRISVVTLILIEIVDAFADRRNRCKNIQYRLRRKGKASHAKYQVPDSDL